MRLPHQPFCCTTLGVQARIGSDKPSFRKDKTAETYEMAGTCSASEQFRPVRRNVVPSWRKPYNVELYFFPERSPTALERDWVVKIPESIRTSVVVPLYGSFVS